MLMNLGFGPTMGVLCIRANLIVLALAVLANALITGAPVNAQLGDDTLDQCLGASGNGGWNQSWHAVVVYIQSLGTSEPTIDRAFLTQLRLNIIRLEMEKQNLIDVVEAHIADNPSGEVVLNEVNAAQIPDIQRRIDHIIMELEKLANNGEAFAGSQAYKSLMIELSNRKSRTLCDLTQILRGSRDRQKIRRLLSIFKEQVQAVAQADVALGEYVLSMSQ